MRLSPGQNALYYFSLTIREGGVFDVWNISKMFRKTNICSAIPLPLQNIYFNYLFSLLLVEHKASHRSLHRGLPSHLIPFVLHRSLSLFWSSTFSFAPGIHCYLGVIPTSFFQHMSYTPPTLTLNTLFNRLGVRIFSKLLIVVPRFRERLGTLNPAFAKAWGH